MPKRKCNTQAFPISIQLWNSLKSESTHKHLREPSTHRTHLEKILDTEYKSWKPRKFIKKYFLSTNESRDKRCQVSCSTDTQKCCQTGCFLMKDIVLMKVCHRTSNKYLHSWDLPVSEGKSYMAASNFFYSNGHLHNNSELRVYINSVLGTQSSFYKMRPILVSGHKASLW